MTIPLNAAHATDLRVSSDRYWTKVKPETCIPAPIAGDLDALDERARRAEREAEACERRLEETRAAYVAARAEAKLAREHATNARDEATVRRKAAVNVANRHARSAALEAARAELLASLAAVDRELGRSAA